MVDTNICSIKILYPKEEAMSIRTDKPSSDHNFSVESFSCLHIEGRKRSGLTDEMGYMA